MAWIRLRLESTADECDHLSDALFDLGASSVVTKPADADARSTEDPDRAVWEPRPDEIPLWDRLVIEAFFPIDTDLAATRHRLGARRLEVDFVEDTDWSQTWRNREPQWFGRLGIAPTDPEVVLDGPPDGVVLRLDPGLAFGSGTHPTTSLCLDWLARVPMNGMRILDVGSGSGILAIAGVLLGARRADAVDYDPQARMATRDNAARNGIAEKIETFEDLRDVTGHCDIVVANILATILIELADALMSRLAPAGHLVLSGVLANQVDWVRAAFPKLVWRIQQREEWVLLHGRREV